MTTKIQKWGNSQAVRIPKHMLDSLNWGDNEIVALTIEDGKVVIEAVTKRKNIKELFADFDGEYTPIEMDWGEPVGKEIW